SLPEDILAQRVQAADPQAHRLVQVAPSAEDLERLRDALATARRPLLVVGGSGWTADAAAGVQAFADAYALPVAASFRREDSVAHGWDGYVGHLSLGMDTRLGEAVKTADLLVALGPRLSEVKTAGYSLPTPPRPRQRLVHVMPSGDEIGRVYQPD